MSGEGSPARPLRVSGAGHVNMELYYGDAPDNNLFGLDDIETISSTRFAYSLGFGGLK